MPSPFLARPASEWLASNSLAFAIRDGFPVTKGHTLIIPKREVETWFDATPDERAGIMELVEQVMRDLDREYHPDGYSVGFNAGRAAGQTAMHLHVHVVPPALRRGLPGPARRHPSRHPHRARYWDEEDGQ